MATLRLPRPMSIWRTETDIDPRYRETVACITAIWHDINRRARTRRYIERTALTGRSVDNGRVS